MIVQQFFNPSAFAPVGGFPGSSEPYDDSVSFCLFFSVWEAVVALHDIFVVILVCFC